jgi:hypothetical protein
MKGGIVHMRDIRQIQMFDMDKEHPLHKSFLFVNKQWIDMEWLQEQINYMDQLSERKKHIVYTYTIYGDKLMNQYIRGNLRDQDVERILQDAKRARINPLKYQHMDETKSEEMDDIYFQNVMRYIPQYIQEFSDIVRESPPLKHPIRVFRGIQNGEYIQQSIKRYGNFRGYYHQNDFLSTSIFITPPAEFTAKQCCILEWVVDPSVRCLFTAHLSRRRYEYDITIEPDTYVDIEAPIRHKFMVKEYEQHEDPTVFLDPCAHKLNKMVTVTGILTKIKPQ